MKFVASRKQYTEVISILTFVKLFPKMEGLIKVLIVPGSCFDHRQGCSVLLSYPASVYSLFCTQVTQAQCNYFYRSSFPSD